MTIVKTDRQMLQCTLSECMAQQLTNLVKASCKVFKTLLNACTCTISYKLNVVQIYKWCVACIIPTAKRDNATEIKPFNLCKQSTM